MKHFSYILIAACLVSCVMLEPKVIDEDSPESAAISFSVIWPEGVCLQDTVYVAMNAVNVFDSEEEPEKYGYRLNPQGEFYSKEGEEHIVKFGNYIFLACTCDNNAVKIDWPSNFISESDIPLENFSARLLNLSDDEFNIFPKIRVQMRLENIEKYLKVVKMTIDENLKYCKGK